jgi:hypothetical protein
MPDGVRLIKEYLSIAKGPIAEEKHEAWRQFKDLNGPLVQLLIIHRWLSIVVGHAHPLGHVHVDEAKQSNREQNGQEHAIEKGDEDLHHN